MFDYLQKFNSLPKELRDRISTPAVMSVIGELEGKYGIDLAVTVMKVMVKDISVNGLDKYLSEEFRLGQEQSSALSEEMKKRVFAGVSNYLGLSIISTPAGAGLSAAKPVSSSFFFDIEDEEEVRELMDASTAQKKQEAMGAVLDDKINMIVNEVSINFGSEELLDRFKKILSTYVRGIRDKIDTKQTLVKPFEAGGMGFDDDSADRVLKIAETRKSEKAKHIITPPKKINLPEDNIEKIPSQAQSVVRDVDYDFSALAKKQTIKKVEVLDTDHELAPPTPMMVKVVAEQEKKEVPKVGRLPEKEEKPVKRNVLKELGIENSPSLSVGKRAPIETTKKARMDDVRVVPKIVSPIDELRLMGLVAFRRLNQNPSAATQKIKEKIKLLEEDGYGKRLEGIKAWRENPVYQSYLEIGNKSMSTNQPVSAIISSIKAEGRDCLQENEFDAVMSLNKDLRF